MDRRIWIVIGVLVLVGLGFAFFSTMTGGVISDGFLTGAVVGNVEEMKIESESFRISDFGNSELNEEEVEDVEGGSR